MVGLMNRSIDIMESLARESGNVFHLNRRGYLYVTADPSRISYFRNFAKETSGLGAGPLRIHRGAPGNPAYAPSSVSGFEGQPTGLDLILDLKIFQKYFPYLSQNVVAAIHARRCGWFSVQQLGLYMLERGKEKGVRFISGRVEKVEVARGRVQAVRLREGDRPATISTPNFVNAAGPFQKKVAAMVGVDLPVFSELHLKISFKDHLAAIPRDAPMVIWTDPIWLPWSEEERAVLAEAEETRRLLGELPSGVHTRTEGGPGSDVVLGLWAYHTPPVEPVFPFSTDPRYPEIVLRGLAPMIPGLKLYLQRLPKAVVDGGYYTKTRENRPLIGKLPVEGAYIIGALSGFGVMAACGAGDLLASYITGKKLPDYASAFALERYEDPEYKKLLEDWAESGQL